MFIPGTLAFNNGNTTFSRLDNSQGIHFKMADIEYSTLLTDVCCESHAINFDIGVRYAHLGQNFEQLASFPGANGDFDVATNIRFDGVGLRTGFDGAWRLGCSRFSAYGMGFINVLFGEFSSHYQESDLTLGPPPETIANWSDDRCVPILDYEVGIKWTSCNGHWVAGTGYYTAFWFNTVATQDFVKALQNSDFNHVDRTIAFTGVHEPYRVPVLSCRFSSRDIPVRSRAGASAPVRLFCFKDRNSANSDSPAANTSYARSWLSNAPLDTRIGTLLCSAPDGLRGRTFRARFHSLSQMEALPWSPLLGSHGFGCCSWAGAVCPSRCRCRRCPKIR